MRIDGKKARVILAGLMAALWMIGFGQLRAAASQARGSLLVSDMCALEIEIEGQGVVTLRDAEGPDVVLDRPGSNRAETSCGELVTLTAVPGPLAQFAGWRKGGVFQAQVTTLRAVPVPLQITAVFVPREVRFLPLEEPIYDRSGELVEFLPVYTPSWQPYADIDPAYAAATPPEITVWYGSTQPFGLPGQPQKWMDVLGNVTDADNDLTKLEYKVNNGVYVPLNFGGNGSVADGRRLYNKGDFAIDLAVSGLNNGSNVVTIQATDALGAITQKQVTVLFTAGQTWPLPSDVDWDQTGNLLNVSAVVDGQWGLQNDGKVHTVLTGYDRVLNIGDISWSNYEAVVPVTINGYDSDGFTGIQYAPAVGVVMGWQGHSDSPIVCDQPKCGWLPVGMATWYEWDKPANGTPPTGDARFKMWVKHTTKVDAPGNFMLTLGEEYLWKVQANRSEGQFGTYRLKVWPVGSVEPATWLMELPGTADSQAQGSLLLLAHHVDATFGDVKLRPINGDFVPPTISNVGIQPEQTSAVVSWNTNEPSTGEVEYFKTPAEVKTVMSDALSTNHQVLLDGLEPDTEYTVRITAEDDSLNRSVSVEETFVTLADVETFTLSVSAVGYGTVAVVPDKQSYSNGEEVTLTAMPLGPLWQFMGWRGDASGKTNPLVLTITKDTSVQAEFQKTVIYLPFVVGE